MQNMIFRVWCKDKNEWEKDSVMLSPDGVLYTEYKGRWMPLKSDLHIVQFSTGLLAAKSYRGESEADRSIFEGDIIKHITSPFGDEVVYHCGSYRLGKTLAHTLWNRIDFCEIIGTVFDTHGGTEEEDEI